MSRTRLFSLLTGCPPLFRIQGYHIEKQIFGKEELQNLEADIDESLRRAGGANYDLGNIRTGVQAGKSTDLKNAVSFTDSFLQVTRFREYSNTVCLSRADSVRQKSSINHPGKPD